MGSEILTKKVIKIKLKSFDHRVLDKVVSEVIRVVRMTGAKASLILLPTKVSKFIVNRSPHIDKESREQFAVRRHCRLIKIFPEASTMDMLMKLDLPAAVGVKIELDSPAAAAA